MKALIAQLKVQLQKRLDDLFTQLEALAVVANSAPIEYGRQIVPPSTPSKPQRKRRCPSRSRDELTPRAEHISNTRKFRGVLAALAEPFDCRDAAEAMAKAHPDLGSRYDRTKCACVLSQWCINGELKESRRKGDGKPTGYSRTEHFRAGNGLPPKEAAWREFRAEIETKKSEDE